MKTFLTLLTTLLLSTSLLGQNVGINFFKGSFSEVKKEALKDADAQKLIFFDCYTSWCGPCKRMAKEFFTTKEAGDFFNENFINYKADMEKGEAVELAKRYKIAMYPTFLILDAEGNEIGRVLGGTATLNDFIEKVKVAMNPLNSAKYLKEIFLKNRSYSNALNYLRACMASGKSDDIYTFINENFEEFDFYERVNSDMWKFTVIGARTLDSPILDFIYNNRVKIDSYVGAEQVNKSLVRIYGRILSAFFSGKSTLSEEQVGYIKYTVELINSDNKPLTRWLRL